MVAPFYTQSCLPVQASRRTPRSPQATTRHQLPPKLTHYQGRPALGAGPSVCYPDARMSKCLHRSAARLVLLVVLVAEVFAFVPQLHGHELGGGPTRPPATTATPATAAATAPGMRAAHGARTAEQDCPACRLASLASVLTRTLPLVVSLPRAAGAALPPLCGGRGPATDRPCGRAPPLA